MRPHIEGMGWMGSLLALRLLQGGKPFSWSDIDAPIRAWPVSTGLVYPAGDARSRVELKLWQGWACQRCDLLSAHVLPSAFVYAHKHPPHGGRYPAQWEYGRLRRAQAPCFAVDVAGFVRAVRERAQGHRTQAAGLGEVTIRSHGYGERLGNLVWGWSAPAWLEFPYSLDLPVALYGKPHRFQTVYAVPRGDHHMIGSSSVPQGRRPHSDPAATMRALKHWTEAFEFLFPAIKISSIGPPAEGWRPKPAVGDSGRVQAARDGRTITLPPMYHSGVRWAPTVIDEALRLVAQL